MLFVKRYDSEKRLLLISYRLPVVFVLGCYVLGVSLLLTGLTSGDHTLIKVGAFILGGAALFVFFYIFRQSIERIKKNG